MNAGALKVVTIRAFKALQNMAMAMATSMDTSIAPVPSPMAL